MKTNMTNQSDLILPVGCHSRQTPPEQVEVIEIEIDTRSLEKTLQAFFLMLWSFWIFD